MSRDHGFPLNDLLRRRLQTSLIVVTLTLSVASTLFLLQFSSRLVVGLGATSTAYTIGLTNVFSQFLLFIGVLVFLVGVVLTSFIVMLMSSQRTRDFGLLKAAGCPNSLVGGYFMTQMLIVTFLSCVLGIVAGLAADFVASEMVFGAYTFGTWWFAPVVFVVFFCLALFFGLQPILKATKMTAIEALSPANYYGLVMTGKYKTLSHSALTWRVASRSMVRRISPIARIVILLSIVFVLLTISVAGGIIARDTTLAWIENTQNPNTIIVAYNGLGSQYESLLDTFSGNPATPENYNFSDPNLALPSSLKPKIESLAGVASAESRLILFEHVKEVRMWSVYNYWIGDHREDDLLVVGLDPAQMPADFSSKGRSLNSDGTLEAVIGDSVSQTMYYPYKEKTYGVSTATRPADPLAEGIQVGSQEFTIVGVCLDSINNGYVTYVPMEALANATGASGANMLFITLDSTQNRDAAVAQIVNAARSIDPDLEVLDLNPTIQGNSEFLGTTWQTIMLIPLFSLASAAICLVSYMMLVVDEHRQEFAVLRAVGAKPKLIVHLSAFESLIVLLSSFGIGVSFGVITTLMILMANPIVTAATIGWIAIWMACALAAMFILSLYPAIKMSKTGILQIGG